MYLKDCVALFEYNNNFSSSYSNMIISGHWDKKIRFWDLRVSSVNPSHELAIQGRVTSLSLFPGKRRRRRREGGERRGGEERRRREERRGIVEIVEILILFLRSLHVTVFNS